MTIETTKIPRRQKCVDKNHPYIGGANDIYDDELDKKQSIINQETVGDSASSHKNRIDALDEFHSINVDDEEHAIITNPEDIIEGSGRIPTANAVAGFVENNVSIYGYYIEHPEFIRLYLDSNDNIIWGIKSDGTIYFGAGVPPQVQNELKKLWKECRTIEDILNLKVNQDIEGNATVPGNITIGGDIDFSGASFKKAENQGEWLDVKTDKDGKILEGVRIDGTKVVNDLKVKGTIEHRGGIVKAIDHAEFLVVWLDKNLNILFGVQNDGNVVFGCGVPSQVKEYTDLQVAILKKYVKTTYGEYEDNPEFLDIKTDVEGKIIEGIKVNGCKIVKALDIRGNEVFVNDNKEFLRLELDKNGNILSGTRRDGSHYVHEIHSETIDALNKRIVRVENTFETVKDAEERLEVKKDSKGNIVSYRKKDGTLVELTSIETPKINLSKEGLDKLAEELNISLPETIGLYKSPNLPKFGTTNIKTETFGLTAVSGFNSISQVELRRDFDDTTANALDRMTICHYYFGSTRLRHYASGKIKLNSSDNKYYAKETIRKVNGVWYYADTLGYPSTPSYTSTDRVKVISGYTEEYTGVDIPAEGDYALIQTEVIMVSAPANVNAWTVEDWDFNAVSGTDIGKKYEHNCIADIDFGHYLNKKNVAVGVKHQGNSTQGYRKRNFRYTFYKNNTYAKKDKIKIGELLRLSKFNLKANWVDPTRIKELVLYRIFSAIWHNRPIVDRYDWDNSLNGLYNGATGNIHGFPIELNVNNSFYGIYTFCLPKDGKNYLIDDEDENTGLFVSGSHNTENDWGVNVPYILKEHYDSEMDDDLDAYPKIIESLNRWTDFINNRLYLGEDTNAYGLTECTFCIPKVGETGTDYYTYFYVTKVGDTYYLTSSLTYDAGTGEYTVNENSRAVTRIYVTDYYWDSNQNIYPYVYPRSETTKVGGVTYVTSTLTEIEDPITHEISYEVNANSVAVTHVELTDEAVSFDKDNIPERLDVLGFIDYFICMQVFVCYDNQHNNVILYSGADKVKMFPFFYDLDAAIPEDREGGSHCDILNPGVSQSRDLSLWNNLKDLYWDDIINRYCALRKTYLSVDYINSVYKDIADNIPATDYSSERTKWGIIISSSSFENKMTFLKERLLWLDENYFNI